VPLRELSRLRRGYASAAIEIERTVNDRNPKPTDSKPKHRKRRPREITIPTLFQLVIECRDENQQRELYEKLTAAGHTCKVMTL
jgi:hypothetical protein